MVEQTSVSVENNFTKGLITESTGLNFPENAATDCDNCEFTLVGDVLRRQGINFEPFSVGNNVGKTNRAISSYKWNNVGGDGLTQLVVEQIGSTLYFYRSSSATLTSALSSQILLSTIDASAFVVAGSSFDATVECQYADGNGYLFVYHPSCDTFYVTYNSGTLTGNKITVKIRDFAGVQEIGVPVSQRPTTLTAEHNYNLVNQGWVAGNPWSASSTTSITLGLGSQVFTVASGIVGVSLGVSVTIIYTGSAALTGIPAQGVLSGTVTAYSGTSMTVNVTSGATAYFGRVGADWSIVPRNTAYLTTWNTATGNYPSNADVWWYFRNSSDVFDPATTLSNVTVSTGKAPGGHFILDAFDQQRDVISGLSITDVTTTVRPRTGCWFQGRVWYTGVDAQQPATGDAAYYTWTENLYFSQIVRTSDDFGNCYQTNDPTSENLLDELPTDGGIIQIQGCGTIYKLFPIQNGLLVFAGNGIYFITGSQGIGFAANDFNVNKVSEVKSISSTSFVSVNGLPYFWNDEGIYSVQPTKGGGLEVDPITVGTILSFYNSIPLSSKRYVRGAYHPIDYRIQWVYRDTEATDVSGRYIYNRILNYNTYNKAFYPYSVTAFTNFPSIHGILYVDNLGGPTAPEPVFKYISSKPAPLSLSTFTFAQERDEEYIDWANEGGVNYDSFFITGYKLKGQAIRKFKPIYVQIYSKVSEDDSGYKIQGLWDYSINRDSGRWSNIQVASFPGTLNFGTLFKRHKIRGSGYALQFKVSSTDSLPFDIQGWAIMDAVNAGT